MSESEALPARGFRRLAPPLLAALAVAAMASYLYVHRASVAETWRLDPTAIVALAALTAATMGLRADLNRRYFGALGVRAGLAAWFEITAVTSFTNYLPFSTGLVAKGLYLRRVHDLPMRRFASSQAALLVLVMATNGLAGVLALVWSRPDEGGLVVGLLLGAMALLALPISFSSRWLDRLPERWRPWSADDARHVRGSWPRIFALQLGILACGGAGLEIALAMGGVDVDLTLCILITAASVLSRLAAITPGALGVRELMIGAVAAAIGVPLRDAVIASAIVRAVEVVIVMGLGTLFTYRVSRQFSRGEQAPD